MCLHGAPCSIPFNLICNMTTFWNGNILTFHPTPGTDGVYRGRICACILLHLSIPLIWYATWPCSKKLNFDILTPPQDPGGVYGQILAIMLMYAPFPLIWCATIPYSTKVKFLALPHPLSTPRGSYPGLQTIIPFVMFHIYCTYVCMRSFSKK